MAPIADGALDRFAGYRISLTNRFYIIEKYIRASHSAHCSAIFCVLVVRVIFGTAAVLVSPAKRKP